MMNRNGFRWGFRGIPATLLVLSVGAIALSNGGCSAANTAIDASQGCAEFNAGSQSIAALSIDGTTRAFVQASSDFVTAVNTMETSVYSACKAIDTDLGVPDTWSAMQGLDAQVTEACTQASTKIKAILAAGDGGVQATCLLAVSGGGCQVSVNAEADCEAKCTGNVSCTPPDVTVTCDPGNLSVMCSGMCMANATCEGSATLQATCQGSCEADCSGECDATATAPSVNCQGTCSGACQGTCDGSTASGTTCAGKCVGTCKGNCTYQPGAVAVHCDGSCKGMCNGNCKLDANAMVNCGAMVRCKGGCTTTGTAPQCEGTVTPAKCNSDVNCQASCQAHAEASASCTPPTASLECDTTATGDLQALVNTVKTNLPIIIQAIQTQGPIVLDASGKLVTAGGNVVAAVGTASGKALACATTAVSAAATAATSFHATVSVSVSVSASCGGPSS